ncbi:hypothetical protein [Mucilaginibacter sp.]|uniref:hypothetical protein n=1 Tax=Mucilaginibacter sp. TaxID=1882438 RepID=UPI0035BC19E3
MNKTKGTLIGGLIWIIITIIYSKLYSFNSNYESIGFPLYFYRTFVGKPGNSDLIASGTAFRIDFIPLLIDLFSAALFIITLNFILDRLFKPTKTNT